MRTKALLLSALVGALGAVAVNAQTNVYSLNAVGYINITAYPGFNLISCPLIGSPDNSLNTLLPDTNGQDKSWQVYFYNPTATPSYQQISGGPHGWAGTSGTNTLSPGQAAWLFNPSNTSYTVTFVGTVPTGSIPTTLYASSFNLVSSAVPASGDLVTNPITAFSTQTKGDQVYTYNPTNTPAYTQYSVGAHGFLPGNPQIPSVGTGFWYFNAQATNNTWTENFTL